MKGILGVQLFGIIKRGSPGTAMPAFKNLTDKKVWQLILYIRGLAR
jgi:cytochrome c1